MPVKVNDFVIQAKFDDGQDQPDEKSISEADLLILKDEIVRECMEKVEEYMKKREEP